MKGQRFSPDDLSMPPESLEAEQSLLGSIFQDDDMADRLIPQLNPTDFYRVSHQRIFAVTQELHEEGAPITPVSVHLRLERHGLSEACGGLVYLHNNLWDMVPTAGHGQYYADEVLKFARQRRKIENAKRLFEASYEGGDALKEAEMKYQQEMLAPSEPKDASKQTAKDRLDELTSVHLTRTEDVPFLGITTGFPTLDRKTNGLRAGQVWLVAGRPGMGKTSLGLSMVRHIARMHPVLLLTLEQTIDEIWNRLLGVMSGIPTWVLTNKALTTGQKKQLDEAYSQLRDFPLTLEYVPGLTAPELHVRVRQAKRDGEAEVVMVDHVGLLDKGGGNANRYDRLTQISNRIKETAGECEVPIVSLIQLSRGGEKLSDKRPTLDLLRDTGAHEENAHCVLGIYRPDYYETEKLPSDIAQDAELLILKAREGETGRVPIQFIPERTYYFEPTTGEFG